MPLQFILERTYGLFSSVRYPNVHVSPDIMGGGKQSVGWFDACKGMFWVLEKWSDHSFSPSYIFSLASSEYTMSDCLVVHWTSSPLPKQIRPSLSASIRLLCLILQLQQNRITAFLFTVLNEGTGFSLRAASLCTQRPLTSLALSFKASLHS